jgi:hypothetical protein
VCEKRQDSNETRREIYSFGGQQPIYEMKRITNGTTRVSYHKTVDEQKNKNKKKEIMIPSVVVSSSTTTIQNSHMQKHTKHTKHTKNTHLLDGEKAEAEATRAATKRTCFIMLRLDSSSSSSSNSSGDSADDRV